MSQPTSFRLAPELVRRIGEAAAEYGTSTTSLVAAVLDEGLKTRQHPGIVYRDGPTGRRAGVVGGPDVWEIVRALRQTPGKGEQRIARLAREIGIEPGTIRLATDFYAAYPDEVDTRIALDQRAAERIRERIARREQLLSDEMAAR